MSVTKSKSTGPTMIASRPINHPSTSAASVAFYSEGCIVDAVRMFIKEHEQVGRARSIHVSFFYIIEIGTVG